MPTRGYTPQDQAESKVGDGRKAVAISGTPERLVSAPLAVDVVYISADDANTNDVYIGASTVDNSTQRGARIVAPAATHSNSPLVIEGPIDLYDIFVDAETGGEAVSFMWIKRRKKRK